MSLKFVVCLLLALGCSLAVAKEETQPATYKLESDIIKDQEVYVAADLFNDPSNIEKEEDETASVGTKREGSAMPYPYDWTLAQAALSTRANAVPNAPAIPITVLDPANYRYPYPYPYGYPYYGYPYGGFPYPGYPYNGFAPGYPGYPSYPYSHHHYRPRPGYPGYGHDHDHDHGHDHDHDHDHQHPRPRPKPRPDSDRRKVCKTVFPFGKVCTYVDEWSELEFESNLELNKTNE